MYLQDAARATGSFEGTIPYLYLDTLGNVTTARGLLVRNLAFALKLPFQVSAGAATPDEITADFNRVRALPGDRVASFYHSPTSPFLTTAAMDDLLSQYLAVEDSKLRQLYGAPYITAPDPAKIALLDIGYQCGAENLVEKWIHLHDSVERQDWLGASLACNRPQAQPARNTWTKAQFTTAHLAGG